VKHPEPTCILWRCVKWYFQYSQLLLQFIVPNKNFIDSGLRTEKWWKYHLTLWPRVGRMWYAQEMCEWLWNVNTEDIVISCFCFSPSSSGYTYESLARNLYLIFVDFKSTVRRFSETKILFHCKSVFIFFPATTLMKIQIRSSDNTRGLMSI
jgi:hypothetical protein